MGGSVGGGGGMVCCHQELLSMQAPGGDWLAVGAKFRVDLKPDSFLQSLTSDQPHRVTRGLTHTTVNHTVKFLLYQDKKSLNHK